MNFSNYLVKQNLSEISIICYKYWIKKFQEANKPLDLFINNCKSKYSISTQKIIISALKLLFKWKNKEFYYPIPRLKSKKKKTLIYKKEMNVIFDNLIFNSYRKCVLARTIIYFLWYTGLRSKELICAKWSDIDNNFIKVYGKGNKERIIPLKSDLLDEWSKYRNSEFIFSNKLGKPIKYSYLYSIFKEIKIILNNNNISPHW
jgi:integrase